MKQTIHDILKNIKQSQPLIHCITNPISINQCANTILATKARAIMAQHPSEVAEITLTSNSLLINLGNITDVRMTSMLISVQTAKNHNIPIVLDAVGVACSLLRKDFVQKIFNISIPSIIKGNYSEIYALYDHTYHASGVDGDHTLDQAMIEKVVIILAQKYQTTILASGKTDIISDGKKLVRVYNGTSQLSSITGSGCMLGSLCATYLSKADGLTSAICACAILGISGELAQTEIGIGTFMIRLMDALSTLNDQQIDTYLDVEVIEIENI